MEKHGKKLDELQKKLGAILYEVEQKRITHNEAANRVVEIREQIDELIQEMRAHSLPTVPKN